MDIFVNGNRLDINDETSIRLNNKLITLDKITASTSTYSYSFNVPRTDNNSKIFDNIDILEKPNKFNKRWEVEIHDGGNIIFSGNIIVNNIDEEKFNCNVFLPKDYSISDLFEDDLIRNVKWEVPFSGLTTINEVNADTKSKYFFPFCMYGLPLKRPYYQSDSMTRTTSKYDLDEYCYSYFNDYFPSLNMVEIMKKCFEHRNCKLQGDIITDKFLNEIYLSTNLDDGQDPQYNLKNETMGEVRVICSFGNQYEKYDGGTYAESGHLIKGVEIPMTVGNSPDFPIPTTYNDENGWLYQLGDTRTLYNSARKQYTESLWCAYNLFDTSYNSYSSSTESERTFYTASYKHKATSHKQPLTITVSGDGDTNMFVNNHIQIPNEGYYEITCKVSMHLNDWEAKADKWGNFYPAFLGVAEINLSNTNTYIKKDCTYFDANYFPLEFQLLRTNVNDLPNQCHNPLWGGEPWINEYGTNLPKNIAINNPQKSYANTKTPFVISDESVALMDVARNPNYICGMSHTGDGIYSGYLKNGKSTIDLNNMRENRNLYNCIGYYEVYDNRSAAAVYKDYNEVFSSYEHVRTTTNYNKLVGNTKYVDMKWDNKTNMLYGTLKCVIKLNRNDMITPWVMTKEMPKYCNEYTTYDYVTYGIGAYCDITVRAVAKPETQMKDLYYGMTSNFDDNLNLFNFTNNKTKISDFISNIQKTFNLTYEKNGNVITMNRNKIQDSNDVVEIDDRVNKDDAKILSVDYPSKISLKFSVNTDEEGFYRSVSDENIIKSDWMVYGERGGEEINISSKDEAKSIIQEQPFSYCWYNDFNYQIKGEPQEIKVPVVSDSKLWYESEIDYQSNMAKDNYNYKQRFWFRDMPTDLDYPVNNTVGEADTKYYKITLPINEKIVSGNKYELNYYNRENTMLNYFFNTKIDSSRAQIEIECFISPEEYYRIINNRAKVKFNDSLYMVCEVKGFDPSGKNKTKLILLEI